MTTYLWFAGTMSSSRPNTVSDLVNETMSGLDVDTAMTSGAGVNIQGGNNMNLWSLADLKKYGYVRDWCNGVGGARFVKIGCLWFPVFRYYTGNIWDYDPSPYMDQPFYGKGAISLPKGPKIEWPQAADKDDAPWLLKVDADAKATGHPKSETWLQDCKRKQKSYGDFINKSQVFGIRSQHYGQQPRQRLQQQLQQRQQYGWGSDMQQQLPPPPPFGQLFHRQQEEVYQQPPEHLNLQLQQPKQQRLPPAAAEDVGETASKKAKLEPAAAKVDQQELLLMVMECSQTRVAASKEEVKQQMLQSTHTRLLGFEATQAEHIASTDQLRAQLAQANSRLQQGDVELRQKDLQLQQYNMELHQKNLQLEEQHQHIMRLEGGNFGGQGGNFGGYYSQGGQDGYGRGRGRGRGNSGRGRKGRGEGDKAKDNAMET